jgi:hypothetical protein
MQVIDLRSRNQRQVGFFIYDPLDRYKHSFEPKVHANLPKKIQSKRAPSRSVVSDHKFVIARSQIFFGPERLLHLSHAGRSVDLGRNTVNPESYWGMGGHVPNVVYGTS